MEKNAGIWLDSEKAYIVWMLKGKIEVDRIESSIDHFHIHGGYGSSKPYLAQDARSEKKLNEKHKHQKKDFFHAIIKHVSLASSIVVYGPAGTKDDLAREMNESTTFVPRILDVLSADSMTTNQMKALVRNYYSKKQRIT